MKASGTRCHDREEENGITFSTFYLQQNGDRKKKKKWNDCGEGIEFVEDSLINFVSLGRGRDGGRIEY